MRSLKRRCPRRTGGLVAKRDSSVQKHQMTAVYDDRGVDVTLVRWALSLTPSERLATLQSAVDSILRLKNASKPRL
jgi:hypothetical protein